MTEKIDLTQFGLTGVFHVRGTLMSRRAESGSPPLFLFGERHSLKQYILANLQNAVDLANLGAISCVGTELIRSDPTADASAAVLFQDLQKKLQPNTEAVIAELLRSFPQQGVFFSRVLPLLLPFVAIESIEDSALFQQANELIKQYMQRRCFIAHVLSESSLFESEAGRDERANAIHLKAELQCEYEWAEAPINCKRDIKLVDNMLALWSKAGRDRAAILNAGSSHQYRIARTLPRDMNYYHIEQP
jgi:hypothetical protein